MSYLSNRGSNEDNVFRDDEQFHMGAHRADLGTSFGGYRPWCGRTFEASIVCVRRDFDASGSWMLSAPRTMRKLKNVLGCCVGNAVAIEPSTSDIAREEHGINLG